MQVSEEDIVLIIVTITSIFLISGGFVVLYISIYNSRKHKYLQEKQNLETAYQKQLLQTRLEMQEETFSTISREIHDNVGQLLSLAKVQLNIAQQHSHTDSLLINDIKSNIGQAMTDLRDIAKSLSSERLQLISLSQAVEQELVRIGRNGILSYIFRILGEERHLSEPRKVVVFRIIQECLQNILKHSKAQEVTIDFEFGNDLLQVAIRDNGIGFDVHKSGLGGMGLLNITQRSELFGGKAVIESIVGEGTTITLMIPYV